MRTELGVLLDEFRVAPADALAAAPVAEYLREMTPDELDLIGLLAERIEQGRRQYGGLQLAVDGRDWRKERDEELVDGMLFYQGAIELLKRRHLDYEPEFPHERARGRVVPLAARQCQCLTGKSEACSCPPSCPCNDHPSFGGGGGGEPA